jgi:hypothetical protein
MIDRLGDCAFVLNEWIDRHVRQRKTSDLFAVGILLLLHLLNAISLLGVVYGINNLEREYGGIRPYLIPALAPVFVVFDLIFVRQCRKAKARFETLSSDESIRRHAWAWKVLGAYLALTFAFFTVTTLIQRKIIG